MNRHDRSTAVVRPRESSDLDGVAAALVQVHARDGYPVEGVADVSTWLQPPGLLASWVAELDGRVVGHVALTNPKDDDHAARLWLEHPDHTPGAIAFLARLFVLPEARGHALGERLARAVMTDADRRGLRLVLDVMTKDAAAVRLYERLGWRRIGTVTHRFGDGRETPAYAYVSPGPAPA